MVWQWYQYQMDTGTDSPLAVEIDMDELGDNERKTGKWSDIWLVTLMSMINFSEYTFNDDIPWNCKAMLACGWELSLIFSTNNSLTTSIKGIQLQCKITTCKLSKSLCKTIRNWTKRCDSLQVIFGAKAINSTRSIKASWCHRVVMKE